MGGEAANPKHRAIRQPPDAIHQMSAQDRPPLFGTWRKAYAFAIALFAIEVALLYAFTFRFS
jgi:hypothetical protein